MRTATLESRIERLEQYGDRSSLLTASVFKRRSGQLSGLSLSDKLQLRWRAHCMCKRMIVRFRRLYLPAWRQEDIGFGRHTAPQFQKAWSR
jgi:hypothetical protein